MARTLSTEPEPTRHPHDNLSHALEREVRGRILSGELPAGDRINEVHLARTLRVSRTPLREALTRLSGEAFVEARPRLGFFVPPLSAEEAEQLYPIRARLDPWALRLAGIPGPRVLRQLAALNDEIAGAATAATVIDADDRFHELLIRDCPNKVLLELIRQMMWRTRRYEYLYFSDHRNVLEAVRAHRAILTELRRHDLAAACRHLELNMSTASPELLRMLGREPV